MSQLKVGHPPAGLGKQVACTLPVKMEKQLRALAERNRWTLSTAIRVAVEEFLAREAEK